MTIALVFHEHSYASNVILVNDSETLSCHPDGKCNNKTLICPNTINSCSIICPHGHPECLNTTIYSAATTTSVTCENSNSCVNASYHCGDLSSFPSLSDKLSLFSDYGLTADDFSVDCKNCVSCTLLGEKYDAITNSKFSCYGTAIDECIMYDDEDDALSM